MKKTIGILGGMGPEATVGLFRTIVAGTRAGNDQDHIPILINNNPLIPDRSAYINGEGPSPVPAMISGIKMLEEMGADFIIIPCNTAHYFFDDILPYVHIPVVNMIDESALWAKQKFSDLRLYGLLSTTGTYNTNLYQTWYEKNNLQIVVPDPSFRDRTMKAIYGKYGLKTGEKDKPFGVLIDTVDHLIRKGAEGIIAGCTEISLVIRDEHLPVPLINPLNILAWRSILLAGYELINQA